MFKLLLRPNKNIITTSYARRRYMSTQEDKLDVVQRDLLQLGNLVAVHFFILNAVYVPMVLMKL
jgi:hypothetical protein